MRSCTSCSLVAVTRNPTTAALPDGAHVVGGDPSHPQTLTKALPGVKAVFISPRALGDATAGAATAELLKLAAEQGAQRVVSLSAVTVEYGGGYQHFADAFKAVEDAAALCHREDEQRTNNNGDNICSHESIHRRKQSGIL